MIENSNHPNLLQFESLNRVESLFHFTSTIKGGISKHNYTSLNLGIYSGDDIDSVSENRQRLCTSIGIDEEGLLTAYQTHGDKICIIDNTFLSKSDLEKASLLHGVDAIITNQKNICIGVFTADCVPILLYDPTCKVLGAVHAGWRGTVAKVVEKTILEMNKVFGCQAENIEIGIGPAISKKYFEVGQEVLDAFAKASFVIEEIGFLNIETDKTHIDLCLANKYILLKTGILPQNIEIANLCTYSKSDLFFSARRQGIKSGRMLTGGIILN